MTAFTPQSPPQALPVLADVMARALRPRKALSVSDWADDNRHLSSKGSSKSGRWLTARNEPLREPMDCWSNRHPARVIVCKFPIQFGKTEVALNAVGYSMHQRPGPIMVCLPGEVSQAKWTAQKLQPMIDETPAVKGTLTSVSSRESANSRHFKDFAGGQLFIEHAGSPARLKSTTVRDLIVDEVDEFAANFSRGGGDPLAMLDGRTTAFPSTSKRLYISTPEIKGISRIDHLYEQSDQRSYHVPCPHCGEFQALQWSGLRWAAEAHPEHGRAAWYVCEECGAEIPERHKPAMLAAGKWVAANPGSRIRGYHLNCLCYGIGLGPRWADMVEEWLAAQGDPARLKTFTNDRLAESYEDPAMRAVRRDTLADRAEPYPLRQAPAGVLAVTAGVDTQDNRLAVQIVGWGPSLAAWTLDYVELPGDPADDAVWTSLVDLLNRPIERENGRPLRVEAVAIDMAGHRTEAVKAFVRDRRVRRPMAIFGATANNARVLAPGKPADVNWKGQSDKKGVLIHQVGTVAVKHMLFGRMATDAERDVEDRLVHLSAELPPEFFAGIVSETFDPRKNRFEKRRGARNEPLDTWVYAYVATHHPELRLHQMKNGDWARRRAALSSSLSGAARQAVESGSELAQGAETAPPPAAPAALPPPIHRHQAAPVRRPSGFVNSWRRGL